MRKFFPLVVFVLGLLGVVAVAAVHAQGNLITLGVCLLIALVYLAGAAELYRYHRASVGLQQQSLALQAPPDELASWLQPLDASLRAVVRLRVMGERIALPAPTLPAYLAGLLVLLGMLGTLLGMMLTLRGTGLALESASDLQTVRDSLAAPVKGLGYAFGTSIAGVATSAALGVLTALARRERVAAGRALDACITGALRGFTRDHRQDETWHLLQSQSAQLPLLIERLQHMAETLERRDEAAHQRQLERQDAFLQRSEAAQVALLERVDSRLQASVSASADAAGRVLQPLVQAVMTDVSASTQKLHAALDSNVRNQIDGVQRILENSTEALLQGIMARQEALIQQLAERGAAVLDGTSAHNAALQRDLLAQQEAALANISERGNALMERMQQQQQAATTAAAQTWHALLEQQQAMQAEHETQRLHAWTTALEAQVETLQQGWNRVGEDAEQRQQQMVLALQAGAEQIATQGRAHTEATVTEVGRLLQAAAEAPRAAADVIAGLRQALSDSLQRDTALLAERNQLLDTVGTLVSTVTQAAGEQKAAIAALVETSATLLEQAGARFDARVEADVVRLDAAATRTTAGALEIASLGDAFSAGVDAFGVVNMQLVERLQAVESTLAQVLQRSDEQLAYYVAQAREVVDLSVLTQRQLVEDLRQLSVQRDAVVVDAA